MRKLAPAIFAILLCSCAPGAAGGDVPSTATPTPCPLPSPVPTPFAVVMLYPMPGATAVPDNLAAVYFVGSFDGTYGPGHYTLTSSSNAAIPLTAPTIAPTPLPSPAATIPPNYGPMRPADVALQALLSPNTTYTFGFVQTDLTGTPPNCYVQSTHSVGSFTTQ